MGQNWNGQKSNEAAIQSRISFHEWIKHVFFVVFFHIFLQVDGPLKREGEFPEVEQLRIGHLLCVHVSCPCEIASQEAMIRVGDLPLTSVVKLVVWGKLLFSLYMYIKI